MGAQAMPRSLFPRIVGLILLVVLAAWAAGRWVRVVRVGEAWLYDFRTALFAPEVPQHPEIVVVTIDEETLAQFPYRSPIRRGFLDELLRKLELAEVRAVGVDILFDQETVPEEDAALRRTMLDYRPLLVVGEAPPNAGLSARQIEFQSGFLDGVVTGQVSLLKDEDGVVRRLYPGGTVDGAWHPGFAQALAGALGAETNDRPVRLEFGRTTDETARFRRFPAHVVAKGLIPAAWLSGKVVLVGADLPQQDRHRTPLGRIGGAASSQAGVSIHAYALAQLLDGTRVVDASAWLVLGLLLGAAGLGALVGWADIATSVKIGLLGFVVSGLIAAAFALYASRVAMVPLMTPLIACTGGFALVSAYAGRHHSAAARFIRRAFAQYLSPQVIERIASRPESLELGGERRRMSFVFSDVAGFTSLSEQLSPEDLVSLLENYLDGMVEIVLRHDGTIDKFVGDAVIVFFGAPADQKDHAARAIACAVEMDRFAERFRTTHSGADSFGTTRIGVHTGVATVGNFGGQRRFDYTALGDTVNIAARLESVNRHLGTRVCISGETVAEGRAEGLRPVGELVLKGKESGIEVFSTGDEETGRSAAHDEYVDAYGRIRDDPEGARRDFEALSRRHPDDGLVAFQLERLKRGATGTRIVMEAK